MHRLRFAIPLLLCLATSATAAVPKAEPKTTDLKNRINQVLQQGRPLSHFYAGIKSEFGATAIKPLLEIASDEQNRDETRWAALFALARVAGKESLGVVRKFMSNSSWMLRDAALKTAAALNARELTPQIEQRLKDDALIVRTTAVETIAHLNLRASAPKLVDALFDPINYAHGKALWIHKHILHTLSDFKYEQAVPKLVDLLSTSKDEKLQLQVVQALERITGKNFGNKPIRDQVYFWKRKALSDATF
jgi:HEAT repeat protein